MFHLNVISGDWSESLRHQMQKKKKKKSEKHVITWPPQQCCTNVSYLLSLDDR